MNIDFWLDLIDDPKLTEEIHNLKPLPTTCAEKYNQELDGGDDE